jgi:phosphoglycerate dehydrogenase-like enzyme
MLRRPPREEILKRLPEVEFLISERAGTIDAEMIAVGKTLRLIQRLGSLTFDIDIDAAREAGVPVSAWPVHGSILVAEHMLMQMLALAKRLNEATAVANEAGDWGLPLRRTDEDTFAYNWSEREYVGGIYEKTVGILGFGEIGAELARRLNGFAPARILYYKRGRLPEAAEAQLGILYAPRDQLISESDFVCNLLPYAPETDMLIDAGFLARLKPGAFLVSCGSGSVIDEAALADAVRAGHVAGAALDTFEWEPIRPDNPLLPLARDPSMNVLLTPHTAAGSGTRGADKVTRSEDYENIMRVLRSEPVRHQVV